MSDHKESISSAALDGARIACLTARVLIQLDRELSNDHKDGILEELTAAARCLDMAREMFPVIITSLHHVSEHSTGVCQVCGCTEETPCLTGGEPCAWANLERTLCTTCALRLMELGR